MQVVLSRERDGSDSPTTLTNSERGSRRRAWPHPLQTPACTNTNLLQMKKIRRDEVLLGLTRISLML
jgi:hypothetical protein